MERQSRPEDAETSPGGFRPIPPDGQNPVCQEEPQKTCGSVPLIETPDYLVGFVELDDLGWFWDRQQKQAVVKEVRKVAQTQDVIIVVFAHGWNHDSSETDGNVLKFRQVLGRLALLEGEAARVRCLTPRRVVGVYLGWRGKAFKRPGRMPATLYNWTSFFSRKATAHRAGAEDAAELLSDLEAIRTKANSRTGNDQHASRMVVIGHSFGTAVVYGAVGERGVAISASSGRLRLAGRRSQSRVVPYRTPFDNFFQEAPSRSTFRVSRACPLPG
jgi:pimeloyl-ACP methyl ester carboxylesterase